ncbi:hypothetical protein [Phycicoccus jejuensis]|uniref:hypothetical protein n=1 Tax=Phycicoccus jejuensis TaxID=367299 RepID=UPI00068FC65D|nr:hypothetical protein [Phycicoccus jejuensis]
MPTDDECLQELERASEVLFDLAGEDVDAIDVKSVRTEEAPFLAKIVSKLSPMVGNLMEQRIVQILDQEAPNGFSWHRQDPGFPDAVLRHESGEPTSTGYEIKAWYVLSTEITGRFKESQHLLAEKNINVVIVAWCMSHMIFGKPKILGVLTVSGKALAASRDAHYHNPPEYLIIEPQDTSARTANLQQSNVNGYKLQASDSDTAELMAVRDEYQITPFDGHPHSSDAQGKASDLMNRLVYRLDTNFAKIDRVGNSSVEDFKRTILAETYLGKTIAQWKSTFADLNGKDEVRQGKAADTIAALYGQMIREEPRTEIAVESEGDE